MIKVGCCGFSTSMKKYFGNFSLVEVNRTFYHYPREKTIEGWRKKAPGDFEFTVKAYQDISHKIKMKAEGRSFEAFERMKKICKTLNSRILLIQTPGSFKPDKLAEAEHFFKATNLEDLALVWETRGPAWETPEIYKKLRRVLENLDVTHVTDPFRILPAYTGGTAYFGLHGLGKQTYYYQHADVELQRLKELVTPFEKEGRTVYVLFNSLSMFEDGLRFTKYLSNETFPRITRSTGLASIREIVEKIRYPTSKSMLIKKLGWRLVETEKGKQIKLGAVLAESPSRTYKNAEELVKDARSLTS